MSGGAVPKRRGTYAENRVKSCLIAEGFHVERSWGSLGVADLTAMRPTPTGSEVWLVQVKYGPSYRGTPTDMSPEARRGLRALAHATGGRAIYCHYLRGRYVFYELLDDAIAERVYPHDAKEAER